MTILGNEALEAQIRVLAAKGALSHAVIFSGQGDLLAAARYTAAAMQCTETNAPCGHCAACSKVLRGLHPDVISVEDTAHQMISMEVLRNLRADAYIIPNEGKRKIYIFPDCERLDTRAQNVLLKVLEEGPPQAAFLFCAKNSAQLLQTIRSRAVEWKLSPVEQQTAYREETQQLCRLLCEKRSAEIVAFCTELEQRKISREELRAILSEARDVLTAALAVSYGAGTPTPLTAQLARVWERRRINEMTETLRQLICDCGYYVNVGHLTGALTGILGV